MREQNPEAERSKRANILHCLDGEKAVMKPKAFLLSRQHWCCKDKEAPAESLLQLACLIQKSESILRYSPTK